MLLRLFYAATVHIQPTGLKLKALTTLVLTLYLNLGTNSPLVQKKNNTGINVSSSEEEFFSYF